MGLAENREREAKAARAAAELARQRESANRQMQEQIKASNALTAAAAAEALRKLQSGQAMTIKERELLGLPGIPASPTTSKQVTPTSKPTTITPTTVSSVPAVDQGAIDRANQAERDRLAREQSDRDRAAQEAREREAAAAAEEQRRVDALARMPKPLETSPKDPVKYATPSDVLIDTNDLPIELILKLTLEKIGGLELISLVRHDTVNGQNIVYRPIKNVSQLAIEYNPQNMVKMPDSADSYFKNFAIKLENHIQQETNELPPLVAYIDPVTENVIIETTNVKADYEIEVQMVSSGKVFDGTIYTEDYS